MPPNVKLNILTESAISDWRKNRTHSEQQLENSEFDLKMEKKHLTYSQRSIRQFGGIDPSIRVLEMVGRVSCTLCFFPSFVCVIVSKQVCEHGY